MRTSESIDQLTKSLITAQKSIKHAQKDAANSHFRNEYATLASVIDASKAVLLENGINVFQGTMGLKLVTRLQHTSGQFIESETDLVMSKQDMQGMGSAITYARRYGLAAILNMSQEDDDGNGASGPSKRKAPPKQTSSSKPKTEGGNDF